MKDTAYMKPTKCMVRLDPSLPGISVSDPWAFIFSKLAPERDRAGGRTSERRRRLDQAIAMWVQAEAMFEAYDRASTKVAALPAYYCCSLACQALLTGFGSDRLTPSHGVRGDRDTDLFSGHIRPVGDGLVPSVFSFFGSRLAEMPFRDICRDLAFMSMPCVEAGWSADYEFVAMKTEFFPGDDGQILLTPENKADRGRLADLVARSGFGNGSAGFEVSSVGTGKDASILVYPVGKDGTLPGLHKIASRFLRWVTADRERWYVFLPVSPRPCLHPVPATLASLWYLSEQARYSPDTLENGLAGGTAFALTEFLAHCVRHVLESVVSEIACRQCYIRW